MHFCVDVKHTSVIYDQIGTMWSEVWRSETECKLATVMGTVVSVPTMWGVWYVGNGAVNMMCVGCVVDAADKFVGDWELQNWGRDLALSKEQGGIGINVSVHKHPD